MLNERSDDVIGDSFEIWHQLSLDPLKSAFTRPNIPHGLNLEQQTGRKQYI